MAIVNLEFNLCNLQHYKSKKPSSKTYSFKKNALSSIIVWVKCPQIRIYVHHTNKNTFYTNRKSLFHFNCN